MTDSGFAILEDEALARRDTVELLFREGRYLQRYDSAKVETVHSRKWDRSFDPVIGRTWRREVAEPPVGLTRPMKSFKKKFEGVDDLSFLGVLKQPDTSGQRASDCDGSDDDFRLAGTSLKQLPAIAMPAPDLGREGVVKMSRHDEMMYEAMMAYCEQIQQNPAGNPDTWLQGLEQRGRQPAPLRPAPRRPAPCISGGVIESGDEDEEMDHLAALETHFGDPSSAMQVVIATACKGDFILSSDDEDIPIQALMETKLDLETVDLALRTPHVSRPASHRRQHRRSCQAWP